MLGHGWYIILHNKEQMMNDTVVAQMPLNNWTIPIVCAIMQKAAGTQIYCEYETEFKGKMNLVKPVLLLIPHSHKCHISSAATALIGPRTLFFHFLLPAGFDWDPCVHMSANTGLCVTLRLPSKRLQICGNSCPVYEFMSASLEIQHSYVNTTYLFIYLKICIRPSEPACLAEWTPA